MLLSIAILAVVGGALAFKVKKDQFKYVCYNLTAPPASGTDTKTTCEFSYTVTNRIGSGTQRNIHYTLVDTYDKCLNNQVTCPTVVSTIVAE